MDHKFVIRFSLQLSILKVNNIIETLPQSAQNAFTPTSAHKTQPRILSAAPFFSRSQQVWLHTPSPPFRTKHSVRNASAFCGELPQPSLGGTSPENFKVDVNTSPQKLIQTGGFLCVTHFLKEKKQDAYTKKDNLANGHPCVRWKECSFVLYHWNMESLKLILWMTIVPCLKKNLIIYMFERVPCQRVEKYINHKDSNTYESVFSVLHDFG